MALARLLPALTLAALLCGCGRHSPPPARLQTGAEDIARRYSESLLRGDWPAAYDTLDDMSKAACRPERFASLGGRYRKQFDFEPTDVLVFATETGDRATAVGVFRGTAGSKAVQRKDGVALRRTDSGWAVVLRENFGRESPLRPSRGKLDDAGP